MPLPRYRVASPPPRPLVLFDGDCRFCQRWAAQWQAAYGSQLDVAPAASRQAQFPEIPASAYDESLQLVEPDGAVYSGAWAALTARAHGRSRRGVLLRAYETRPGVARLFEWVYRIVARHRRIFSLLMR
jgi:predicted DCC family thiol-disulfide oxidoreductase YuxK